MAKEKDYVKPANTFIDKGITLQAEKLSGSESVRIDGLFVGEIDLGGYLQVGETGQIEGKIRVAYALIAGEIKGNIACKATIHLASTARIYGDISTGSIIIDDGASFFGSCSTSETGAPEVVVV